MNKEWAQRNLEAVRKLKRWYKKFRPLQWGRGVGYKGLYNTRTCPLCVANDKSCFSCPWMKFDNRDCKDYGSSTTIYVIREKIVSRLRRLERWEKKLKEIIKRR